MPAPYKCFIVIVILVPVNQTFLPEIVTFEWVLYPKMNKIS